jgi:hypothetical protein
MYELRGVVVVVTVAVSVALVAGCEKGTVQKAGERVDGCCTRSQSPARDRSRRLARRSTTRSTT